MTLRSLYNYVRNELANVCSDPSSESLVICGIDRTDLAVNGDGQVEIELRQEAENAVSLRKNGVPLQYITGTASFYGREFSVGDGVLIPRFDTEVLIDCAKELLKDKESPTIVDLCSGSGAIAITLQKEIPHSTVYAVEFYDKAAEWLVENIDRLGSSVIPVRCDVTKGIPKELSDIRFDMIISNPPYIDGEAMKHLPADVRREPHTALCGGADGLLFYRVITSLWPVALKDGGALVFEIGFDQRDAVSRIMEQNGFSDAVCKKDFAGNDRVIFGTVG